MHNKIDQPLRLLGKQSLKNVEFPTELYSVEMPWEAGVVREKTRENSNDRRIAVLPFSNISPDPRDEYLADGLTEELITTLSEVQGLDVISRTSIMRYKNNAVVQVKEISKELDAGLILEGSVRKAGDDLRITVQLIDTAEDRHVWSKKFDRKLEKVFAIQTEIAETVSSTLQSTFFPSARARIEKESSRNAEAYNLFLKGRYFMRTMEMGERFFRAIECFEKALVLEPNYGLALSGISECYTYMAGEEITEKEGFAKAKHYAKLAIDADPELAEAHCSLGIVSLQSDYDIPTAEREFKRAIELNSSYSTPHLWLGDTFGLSNRAAEAERENSRALELDPLWAFLKWHIGKTLYNTRRYYNALNLFNESLDLDPRGIYPRLFKGLIFVEKGKFDDALRETNKAVELTDRLSYCLSYLGYVLAVSQRKKEAAEIIDEITKGDRIGRSGAFDIGLVYLGLQEDERAVEFFEKAYRDREASMILFGHFPVFDRLKQTNEKFAEIMKKIGVY